MFKNVASKIALFAFDTTTGAPKVGDSANLTAYVSKDYGTVTVLTDTTATELDSTNAKGVYLFDTTQAETNADVLVFSAKSATSPVSVVPVTVFTTPNRFSSLVIDANGLADATAVKVGPTGAGTAQTARDLGTSVLLSSGVGTGQVKLSAGYVAPNWADVGSPTTAVALTNTTIATTQKVDVDTIKTNTVVNAGTVTFPTNSTLASTTNLTGGTVTNVTTVNGLAANVITAASIADGAIDRATFAQDTGLQPIRSNTAQAGSTTTVTLDASASAVDAFYANALLLLTGGTGAGQARFITAYVGSTKVATVSAWATNPDATSTFAILPFDAVAGASVAQISTAVWTDLLASSDFSTASSIGKLLKDSVDAAISSRMATYTQPTGFLAATFPGGTVANTTNLTAGTVAAVSGAVGSVTAAVTVGTNNDKTGYGLSSTAVQAIWDALTSALTSAGSIGKYLLDHLVGILGTGTHTAQTGDSFARLGSAGAGLTALGDTRIANLDAAVSTRSTYAGGAVASVTGAVGSVGAGGITAATFAAGAIDAAAIATDAIGSAELAASAVTEIQAGLSILDAAGVRTALGLAGANLDTQLAAVQSDTDNIQTRLPAALVGGRIDASVGAMATGTFSAAAVSAGGAEKIADITMRRTTGSIEASSFGDAISLKSLYGILAILGHKVDTVVNPGFATVYKADGTTELAQVPLTTTPTSDFITVKGS